MSAGERDVSCVVCGSSRIDPVHTHSQWELHVVRCRDCRMHFTTNPVPNEGDWEIVEGVDDWPEYVEGQRGDDETRLRVLERLRALLPATPGRPTLFDVGAGVGDFVKLANAHGFDATGNDLSARGVALAKERNGLDLTTTPIEQLPDACTQSITMWCVLAHVDDPGAFLDNLLRMLEPGGVLFLRTPGWSVADRYGFALARLSKGRFARMAERRMNSAHMFLYDQKNITKHLSDRGFTDVVAERVCHYPFRTTWYLKQLGGVLGTALVPVARVMDGLIDRDRFVRNTLFVYARRPLDPAPTPDTTG